MGALGGGPRIITGAARSACVFGRRTGGRLLGRAACGGAHSRMPFMRL